MKRFLLFLAVLAPLVAAAIEVTDDRGKHIAFDHSPRRIVTLLPSLTETVCELQRCDRLVGVDRYSDYPQQVRALPNVGGGIDPSIEAIVALKPDVVLAAASSRGIERLESLGLKVVALEPHTGADVQRVMATLGQLLEAPDALRIWRGIEASVAAAARSLPPQARSIRVYFEVSRGPYGAGAGSFIGEMMERLGVQNIVAPQLGPFPKLNPEYVVRANPDLIMIGDRNAAELEDRPGWRAIRAVRENRVCLFSAAESNVIMRPGPRMAEAARIMAACIVAKGALAPAPAGK